MYVIEYQFNTFILFASNWFNVFCRKQIQTNFFWIDCFNLEIENRNKLLSI